MSILRELFGPSRNEIWEQLSRDIGAEFIEGSFWKGAKVQATHGQWSILLDTYTVSSGKHSTTYTRLRAPYVNPDQFRFTIYRQGFFSDVAKWFGMQDVEVGHMEFDRDFIIKGTDERKLRALFSNRRLRELIATQPQIHLTVKDNEGYFGPSFPENTDELCFHTAGVIRNLPQLKILFEMFSETLDQLCRIGSAYEGSPDVELK